jgi:hypothetical protein
MGGVSSPFTNILFFIISGANKRSGYEWYEWLEVDQKLLNKVICSMFSLFLR